MDAAKRRNWILVSTLVLSLTPAGCKEGDPIGGISPAKASFVADERDQSVVSNYVSLRTSSVDEGRIILDIVVSEVAEPIMAIAMMLDYPEEFSKFISCTDGDLLQPPDDCLEAEPDAGKVFISRSTTQNQATPVSGDRVIARVEFLVFGPGDGPITIVGQNLGGGETTALLNGDNQIIFVDWFSGRLQGE